MRLYHSLYLSFALLIIFGSVSYAQKDIPEWIKNGSRIIDKSGLSHHKYKNAVDILTEQVNQGNMDAAHFLGRAYMEGKGVKQNKNQGYSLIKRSADEGNYAIAQGTICKYHTLGKSFKKNISMAKSYCLKSAKQGWMLGQRRLGRIYLTEKDLKNSAYWYEQAANQGDAYSMYMTGMNYMNGHGTPKDKEKSELYLMGASEMGNRQAQFNLGYAYYRGDFLEKNDVSALKLYRKAAHNNHTRGQLNYGMMYWGGMGGVAEDHAEAYKWMTIAASNSGCKYANIAKGYQPKLAKNLSSEEINAAKNQAATVRFSTKPICE